MTELDGLFTEQTLKPTFGSSGMTIDFDDDLMDCTSIPESIPVQ